MLTADTVRKQMNASGLEEINTLYTADFHIDTVTGRIVRNIEPQLVAIKLIQQRHGGTIINVHKIGKKGQTLKTTIALLGGYDSAGNYSQLPFFESIEEAIQAYNKYKEDNISRFKAFLEKQQNTLTQLEETYL